MAKRIIVALVLVAALLTATAAIALAAPPDPDRQAFVCDKSGGHAGFCIG